MTDDGQSASGGCRVNPSPPVREHLRVRDRLRNWIAVRFVRLGYRVAPDQACDHLNETELREMARGMGLEVDNGE